MLKYAAIIILLASLIACAEETIVNEISGTIYLDCSYAPFAGAEISLKANPGESFSEPLILGGGIADQNGGFQFTYELQENEKGNGDLILTTASGFKTVLQGLRLNRDLRLAVFNQNTAHVYVNLSGTRVYAATDTLFLGLQGTEQVEFSVQPQNGRIDTLSALIPNKYDGPSSGILYYGIGSASFALAKEALSIPDSSFNHLNVSLSGCLQNDLVDLVIN